MISTSKFRETLTRLYQRFNVLQRGEKRCFGVTMSQCVTLELLYQEGHHSVRELADGLGLDTSTVTRIVDVLVRDGWVERARDERDRRRVFVSLTPRGEELAAQLEGCADRYCERILGRIPAESREDVVHVMRLLVEAIDEIPGTCG